MYDVIIAGAGPAGATLARLLAGHRSVLLLDGGNIRGDSPEGGIGGKCCGGLLAPDAQAMLDRFDLSLPDNVLDSRQPLAVRALDLATGISRPYPRTYINMDRVAFDQWLLSLVPDTVTVRAERVISIERPGDSRGWEVRLRGPAGDSVEQCVMLVGADGAGSAVRRLAGRPPRPEIRYLAVQDTFAAGADNGGEYLAFFHPALTDFYGWVIPKRGRTLLGVAFPPRSRLAKPIPERMRDARHALERYGYVFPEPGGRRGCVVLRPSLGDVWLGADGVFCIGEAAGLISPSSAEGLSYAFASAAALARSIRPHADYGKILGSYRRGTMGLRLGIAGKNVKSFIMYSPALRNLVMRSGVLAGGPLVSHSAPQR